MSASGNLLGCAGWLGPLADLSLDRNVLEDAVFARLDLWWVLLAVPLAVGAYIWAARQRRRGLESLGNPGLVHKLVASVHPGLRTVRAVLVTLALACVSGGLLRMQYGGVAEIVPAAGLDVVLVVDYSKSMLARDVYPTRSERLEAELTRFLDDAERRGDRVGVVVFAGRPRGLPLSRDSRLLRLYLEHADPRFERPGGTAIGPALDLALKFLTEARAAAAAEVRAELEGAAPDSSGAQEAAERARAAQEADQVVILLTDGEDTTSRPAEVAERAAQLGVKIYTVGIGSRSGEPIQLYDDKGEPSGFAKDDQGKVVMTRLDEETLKSLAEATGGEYVHVSKERFGLDEVRELMSGLARAQREDTIEIHRQEGFAFWLAPAILLLTVSLVLGDRRAGHRGGGKEAA